MKIIKLIYLALAVSIVLAGQAISQTQTPASSRPAGRFFYHKVLKGETLWRISNFYNISIEDIIELNSISDVQRLKTGQQLKIPFHPRKRKSVEIDISGFNWPARGELLSYFKDISGGRLNKGIDIKPSDSLIIYAARDGVVEFSEELRGHGYTVIIKHPQDFTTIYSNLSSCFVKNKDFVKLSQPIGKVGKNIRSKEAFLHFEIRRKDEPLNPLHYLP